MEKFKRIKRQPTWVTPLVRLCICLHSLRVSQLTRSRPLGKCESCNMDFTTYKSLLTYFMLKSDVYYAWLCISRFLNLGGIVNRWPISTVGWVMNNLTKTFGRLKNLMDGIVFWVLKMYFNICYKNKKKIKRYVNKLNKKILPHQKNYRWFKGDNWFTIIW